MTAQLICSQQCVAVDNILAGPIQPSSHDISAHLLTLSNVGWIQYFSWSPYSHPVLTTQLICSQQCVAGYNILAGHHTAIQSWQFSYLLTAMYGWVQYFSWSPSSHPIMTAQLICSLQGVAGYNILAGHHLAIQSHQCVAGYNILAGQHTAIQSWQLSYLLTAMCGWVQYFRWSPYTRPVMTAQLICSRNVWLGTIFSLVTIHPSSHDTSAHLLTAVYGWVQYFSWSPCSHDSSAHLLSAMCGWVLFSPLSVCLFVW